MRATAAVTLTLSLLLPPAAGATPCGAPAHTLGCGEWYGADSTLGSADMDNYPGYTRPDSLAEDGPEVVLQFDVPLGVSSISVSAMPEVATDVDLFLLEPTCDSTDVTAGENSPSYSTEFVYAHAVTGGQTLYIVIDSPTVWGGVFNAIVACDGAPYEQCHDLTDNDGDWLMDCDDPDCFLETDCASPTEICNDGADNDNDGLIDCDDDDCENYHLCGETLCLDGLDNDSDGLTDCCDDDCASQSHCWESANCSDGVDNDCDTLIDCDDADCNWACGSPEDCSNGVDDDLDGLVDCSDLSDCACDPACNAEICDNGVDDDGDGMIDCLDCACWCAPNCPNECGDCFDSVDNDGDGWTDCADDECLLTEPDCSTIPEDCFDLFDNDGDGLVDCCDPDCAGEPACLHESSCVNGYDDDCDGLVDEDDPDCEGDDDDDDAVGDDDDDDDDSGADDDDSGAGDDDATDDDDDFTMGDDDDTGGGTIDDPPGACGCGHASTSPMPALTALAGLVVALGTRRRRVRLTDRGAGRPS